MDFISDVQDYSGLQSVTKEQHPKASMSQYVLKRRTSKRSCASPNFNENYEVGINLSEDGFANRRMIVHAPLESIFDFRPMTEVSPEQLRKLVSVYLEENTVALQKMGPDVDSSEFIWVHITSLPMRASPSDGNQRETQLCKK